MTGMECASCKTPLPEKARFCLDCGAKAPDVLKSEPEDPWIVTLIVIEGDAPKAKEKPVDRKDKAAEKKDKN